MILEIRGDFVPVCKFDSRGSRVSTRILLWRGYSSQILVILKICGDFVPVCKFDSRGSRESTRIYYAVDMVLKYLWFSRYVETSFLSASLTQEEHEYLHVFNYAVDMVLRYLWFSRYVEKLFWSVKKNKKFYRLTEPVFTGGVSVFVFLKTDEKVKRGFGAS